jgi:hypothetical protein
MKRIYPTGKDHPMFGKKHSLATRQKMSKNHWDCSGKNHPMYGVKRLGKENPAWKRGWFKNVHGYIVVSVDGKEVYQHRMVMEKSIGRKLLPSEVVHHINNKRDDNRIENLKLLPNQSSHRKQHKENFFCKVDGCFRPYCARGFCREHYHTNVTKNKVGK